MAILLSAQGLSLSFAGRTLFENLSFALSSGERIALIGPNGAGKSSLLRILAGELKAEEGTVSTQRGLRLAYLPQVPSFQEGATVLSTVMEASKDPYDWEEMGRATELIGRLGFQSGGPYEADTPLDSLSGGWRKRVAVARELMKQPDLFLLDEPTNHLDVEGILWLEALAREASFATLTVTHDRFFLDRVSNRILELDFRNPGGLISVNGTYSDYLQTKETLLATQERTEERLRNTLRRETEWLRRGAKARTTKQQARIDRAEDLGKEVEDVSARNRGSVARLDFQGTGRSPKRLLEATGISKSYNGRKVIPPMDLRLGPGSRVGLLGANGAGKSTLIRLLLTEEKPDTGEVFRSDQLEPVYFEQGRDSLEPENTVFRTVCPAGDHVDHGGKMIHAKAYLDRFLFRAEQMEMPVGRLSGGEQARLLLARLMLRRSNLLILDEPTNDLDIATLNVLEDVLQEFPGAVLLVTHDRAFLDKVATDILAIGPERIERFTGVEQWEEWHRKRKAEKPKEGRSGAALPSTATANSADKKRKLSFKEQRELELMEKTIEAAENRVAQLAADCEAHATDGLKLPVLTAELAAAEKEVERLYARWAELS